VCGRGGGAEGRCVLARVNHDIEHDSAGGEGQGATRPLCGPRSPLEFSFPLMRLGGLRVRVHWIVPLYAACELVACLPRRIPQLPFVGAIVGSLIVLVVLTEAARGLVARRLGSGVGAVSVWPLGGLESTASPGVGRPVLCEAGGLILRGLLAGVFAIALWKTGAERAHMIFDPFRPLEVLSKDWPLWRVWLWSAYYANGVLLIANMALPMFPFDLGRMIAAGRRDGNAAEQRVGRFGMFCAMALLVIAATKGETRLMGVAAFGFLASYLESRRPSRLPPDEGTGEQEKPEDRTPPSASRPAKVAKVLVPEGEVDRVLEKISREGLPSLTLEEREVLSRETERRRGG
jgi:hypothetical protein